MSPCRTLQWRRPARSSRARASASMSSDMSRPRPRSIAGPNSSSMRPVPVPRSSSERNGLSASAALDRLLDRLVGDMQLADAIPFGGMTREIFLRGRRARRAHRCQPLAVAGNGRVIGIEPRDQFARQRGADRRARPAGRKPRSLRGSARPSPASASRREMPRDARLRLPQNVGEVGDRQLGLGQQRDDAQARLFAGGLERAVEGR